MPTPESKACTKCGETKPLSEYYAEARFPDGHRPDCKECRLAQCLAYSRANAAERAAAQRARRAANLEAHRARERTYAGVNREAKAAYARAFYREHSERWDGYRAKRKAQKYNREHRPYTRREIYDRDGGRCCMCGVEVPFAPHGFHIDHIVPLSLDGADTPANVQLACPPCNMTKHTRLEGQIHFAV